MTFWGGLSQLRTILSTETDNDSPGSEELFSQLRENIEALTMLILDSGVSGTATKDPSGTTETKFFDSAKTFTADTHNGRTLLIKSGSAIGNLYTIDDTLSGATLVLTGDNLYADGVRSGDEYKILHDVKGNVDGHDHDGINSPVPVLGDSSIAYTKLKLSSSSQSVVGIATTTLDLVSTYVGFLPLVQSGFSPNVTFSPFPDQTPAAGSWVPLQITVAVNQVGVTGYVIQYYITASGEVFWIFVLRDKETKKVKQMWVCPDHPSYCYGKGIEHPFSKFDSNIEEIIVITLDPNSDEFKRLNNLAERAENDNFIKAIEKNYDVDESVSPPWPNKLVSLGIEGSPLKAWMNNEKIIMRKGKIQQPSYVKTARLKRKEG